MAYGIQVINGFLLMTGAILAAAFFRIALNMSLCG